MAALKWYFVNLIMGVDQLVNALFGGYHDETISSRLGKSLRKNKHKRSCAFYVCKFLDIFDKSHCEDAIEDDEGVDRYVKDEHRI